MKKVLIVLLSFFMLETNIPTYAEETIVDEEVIEEVAEESFYEEIETIEEIMSTEEWDLLMDPSAPLRRVLSRVRVVGKFSYDGTNANISLMSHDGEYVYCLNPYMLAGIGDDYSIDYGLISESTKQKLFRITNSGYPQNGRDSDEWFVATQLAVWQELGYYVSAKTVNGDPWDVSAKVSQILNDANNFVKRNSHFNSVFELNINEPIEIADSNNVISQFGVSGVKGVSVNQSGNKLNVAITSEDYIGIIQGSKGLTTGGLVYSFPGKQSVYKIHRSIANVEYRIQVKLITGSLELHKIDEFENDVNQKVSFLITREDGTEKIVETSSNGKLKLDLLPGKYTLQEVKVGYPYLLSEEVVEFEIVGKKTTSLVFSNEIMEVPLTIKKLDLEDNDIVLEGATFEITDVRNETSKIYTTDENGLIDISEYKYSSELSVCEVEAPIGYELAEEPCKTIYLTPNEDESYEVVFENMKRRLNLEFYKCETNNITNKLNDAWFVLSNNDEELLVSATGRLTISLKDEKGLPLENINVELYSDEELTEFVSVKNTDSRGELVMVLEEGTYYSIDDYYKEVNKHVVKQGQIFIEDLVYGDEITACEMIAPFGYHIDPNCRTFVIEDESSIYTYNFDNERIVHEIVPMYTLE